MIETWRENMDPKHTTPRADYEWLEEHKRRAVELFRGGYTANEIAGIIGCTRNAVIGKMRRLGEKSPNKNYLTRVHGERKVAIIPKPKVRPNMQTINARAARRNPTQSQGPLLPVERRIPREYIAPKATRKKLQGLKERDCRWPCGNPGESSFFFCGAPQAKGMSYCGGHCRVAYQSASGRR